MWASTPATELNILSSVQASPLKKRQLKSIVIRCREILSKAEIKECLGVLNSGGVMVIPTDTVYGIACNAFNFRAVQRVYGLKGRSYHKPLPIFLNSTHQLPLVAKEIPREAGPLIKKYWPGPLTLIFKTLSLALVASGGRETIAVRVPDHGVVKDILDKIKVPLAVTSANISGKKSFRTGKDVRKAFSDKVDLIIDAGRCRLGVESTIVDVTHYPFTVLREGAISKANLLKCLQSAEC